MNITHHQNSNMTSLMKVVRKYLAEIKLKRKEMKISPTMMSDEIFYHLAIFGKIAKRLTHGAGLNNDTYQLGRLIFCT